jgi:hypothetical protein
MPAVQAKKFYWITKRSAWQETQAWREKRRAMAEEFQSKSATLANSFASAQANLVSGSVTIAIEAATARIQAAVRAKFNTVA